MSAVRQETKSFQAEIKQLLHIVVHSLYSNKEIFLRELVSNASDAIDKLRFEALSNSGLYEQDAELDIRVAFDEAANTLTITDNGIGMNRDEVETNLGTIAKSGTKEFLSQLTGDKQKDANLIGQFGVGFYSAFMVADKVTVETRRAGSAEAEGVRWESSGDGEYDVATIEKAKRGTVITLHLKEDEKEFANSWRLRSIINKYCDHLNIPVLMQKQDDDGKALDEWEAVNKATALWTLPKAEIKDEQYEEFYKHISHDFQGPLKWVHKKMEGNIDYTCLLYLPSHAPFDLWQRDAKHGLKLYVQRVFIMDHVEKLLPHYLRFVKGVLDTNALPLNISREILQDHHTMPKLRSAIVRHVLDLLDKLAKDDPEKYETFWAQFGSVLKEGPAEDFANRDRIAKLLRFHSTHADGYVTLSDYVGRMKEGQDKIYYITAENLSTAKSSPHLEIFAKKDIEVLLLVDRIDEWVVTHLPEFDGKSLQSVAKGDLSLDDDEKKEDAKPTAETESVISLMKAVLDSKVKEIRASHRLTTSPVCLVRDQDAMAPQMERLLKAAGQEVQESKPILEINPEHAIIKRLTADMDAEKQKDWINLLFDQAQLAEGTQLVDPADFVRRMNQLWMEII